MNPKCELCALEHGTEISCTAAYDKLVTDYMREYEQARATALAQKQVNREKRQLLFKRPAESPVTLDFCIWLQASFERLVEETNA